MYFFILRWGFWAPKGTWDTAKIALLGTGWPRTWTQASDFRLHALSITHNLLSAYLACVWASRWWGVGGKSVYLFNLPVDCLVLLPSKADWCTPTLQLLCTNPCWMDGWKFLTTAGKNKSCWRVCHQGHLCAWRTACYVEGTDQGIHWKVIETWLKLGSQGSEALLMCSLLHSDSDPNSPNADCFTIFTRRR